MGTFHNTVRRNINDMTRPSRSEDASLNRAGGTSFEISNPAVKLITMTGGSFFAEPRYYEGTLTAERVSTISGTPVSKRFGRLKQRLKINEDETEWLADDEIDEVTREIVATACDVARSDNPEDLLIIARWLRQSMNIRSTPQALLVFASRIDSTQPYVRKYASEIVVRPDEVKTVMLIHRWFFGMSNIKSCLSSALANVVSGFSEKALLKYDGSGYPKWRDVLQTVRRKKDYPLNQGLYRYFTFGDEPDNSDAPVVASRCKLTRMDEFNDEAKRLALESGVNWEVLISEFGSKPEIWTFLVEHNLMGYMALLRNLRNILEADVDFQTIQKVSAKLSDRDEVLKSRQLPFRFMAAMRILDDFRLDADSRSRSELMSAVERAMDISADNVPEVPGLTVIFVDNSGSMNSGLSRNSTMSCADAANALGGILAKRAEGCYVCALGTDVAPVSFSTSDSVLNISDRIRKADTNGVSTNGYKCVEYLKQLASHGVIPDRAIFLSDMQMWNDCMFGERTVCDCWDDYLNTYPDARNVWAHCVHINGYGDNVLDESQRITLVGGFSQNLFSMLVDMESGEESESEVPALDTIRAEWSL